MARTRLSCALLLASAVALLGNAPTSNAATELEITALGGSSDATGDGTNFNETRDSTGPSLSFGESASSPAGSTSSSGTVGFGWARGLSTASHDADNEGIQSQSTSTAQALFRDDLTITAPGVPGGGGTVTFLIAVSGSLVAVSTTDTGRRADASWNAFARASTQPSGGRIAEGDVNDSSFGFFENGGGALVTDFSITSGSGADYGEPIPAPEPAAGLLVLASLVAIGWLERARVA